MRRKRRRNFAAIFGKPIFFVFRPVCKRYIFHLCNMVAQNKLKHWSCLEKRCHASFKRRHPLSGNTPAYIITKYGCLGTSLQHFSFYTREQSFQYLFTGVQQDMNVMALGNALSWHGSCRFMVFFDNHHLLKVI
mgnify:CR=1 FL=1